LLFSIIIIISHSIIKLFKNLNLNNKKNFLINLEIKISENIKIIIPITEIHSSLFKKLIFCKGKIPKISPKDKLKKLIPKKRIQ